MSGASERATEVALPHACERMAALIADPRCGIRYSPWCREFGIVSPIGGWQDTIGFCPFCGAALPPSLREKFFDRHPDADEPPFGPDGDRWWREDPVLSGAELTVVTVEGKADAVTPAYDRRDAQARDLISAVAREDGADAYNLAQAVAASAAGVEIAILRVAAARVGPRPGWEEHDALVDRVRAIAAAAGATDGTLWAALAEAFREAGWAFPESVFDDVAQALGGEASAP